VAVKRYVGGARYRRAGVSSTATTPRGIDVQAKHPKHHTPSSEDGTDVPTRTTTHHGSQSDIFATR
jgi:hypothetical protein